MVAPVLGSVVITWCPCTCPEQVTTWILSPAPAPAAPTDRETDSSSSALMFTLGVLLYSDAMNIKYQVKINNNIKYFFNIQNECLVQ